MSSTRILFYIGCLLLLLMLLTLSGIRFASLSGSYSSVAYRLKVVDGLSRPIPGVEVHVLDSQGDKSYEMPICNYADGRTPTTDGNGQLLLFHCGTGCDYEWRAISIFNGLFSIVTVPPPNYIIAFSDGKKTLGNLRFLDFEEIAQSRNQLIGTTTCPCGRPGQQIGVVDLDIVIGNDKVRIK